MTEAKFTIGHSGTPIRIQKLVVLTLEAVAGALPP
jgi:hypothetical protein